MSTAKRYSERSPDFMLPPDGVSLPPPARADASTVPGRKSNPIPPPRLDFSEFSPPSPEPVEAPPVDELALAAITPIVLEVAAKAIRTSPPSFPWFAAKVLDAAEDENTTIDQLARLISQDALIASQVLRMANSAAYLREERISDLHAAIVRLGLREVAQIAAVASTEALLNPTFRAAFSEFPGLWRDVWLHSISTSLSAGWLAAHIGSMQPSQAILGGLLHDIGRMIGLHALGLAVQQGLVLPQPPERALELVSRLHLDVGIQVAESCKYPDAIFIICRLHHAQIIPQLPARRELAAVILAQTVDDVVAGAEPEDPLYRGAQAAAELLRIDQVYLRALATQVRRNRQSATSMASGGR